MASQNTRVPAITVTLPYGLAPAPEPNTQPFDLGDVNPQYRGSKVVFDPEAPLDLDRHLTGAQDNSLSAEERSQALANYLEGLILAWNFTAPSPDGGRVPLPQPREGGIRKCPQLLLRVIMEAYQSVLRGRD